MAVKERRARPCGRARLGPLGYLEQLRLPWRDAIVEQYSIQIGCVALTRATQVLVRVDMTRRETLCALSFTPMAPPRPLERMILLLRWNLVRNRICRSPSEVNVVFVGTQPFAT